MKKFLAVFIVISVSLVPTWGAGQGENPVSAALEVHKGSDKNDIGENVVVHNGDIYIAGVTLGELEGCHSSGKWDPFLIRYDQAGNVAWVRQWGTKGRDSGTGVAADHTGIYVCGYTEGPLDGNAYAGEFDVFLSKFSFEGRKLWTRQWGTEVSDEGMAVCTFSGRVYVTGFTKGNLDGGKNSGDSDLFLTGFTPGGEKIFTVQKGSIASEWGKAVTADETGLYVAGFTMGVLEGSSKYGYDDIILVKFDSAGNEQWVRQWGTPGNDEGNAVTADSEGIYVAGRANGDLDGNKRIKLDDAFVSKFRPDGYKEWTVLIGTYANDQATGTVVKDSAVYSAGSTAGQFRGKKKNGYGDVWLSKISLDGKLLWTVQHGTGGFDFAGGLTADSSGLYLTGDSSFTVDGVRNPGDNRDLFLIRWEE